MMSLKSLNLEMAPDNDDAPVSLEQQVEGELLAPRIQERREEIEHSQQQVLHLLQKLDVDTSELSELAIAHLLAVDPNLLHKIAFNQEAENNAERTRGLWASITGITGDGWSGSAEWNYTPSYGFKAKAITEVSAAGSAIREAIVFGGELEGLSDTYELKRMREGIIQFEVLHNPHKGLAMLERCRDETELDIVSLAVEIANGQPGLLPAIQQILTESEWEALYERMWKRSDFATDTAHGAESHYDMIGRLHRETKVVQPRRGRRRRTWDIDDLEDEDDNQPRTIRRSEDDANALLPDQGIGVVMLHFRNMNTALGAARYFLQYPDRINDRTRLLNSLLGTIVHFCDQQVPNEVMQLTEQLLQQLEAIADPNFYIVDEWSDLMPTEGRTLAKEIDREYYAYLDDWRKRREAAGEDNDWGTWGESGKSKLRLEQVAKEAEVKAKRRETWQAHPIPDVQAFIAQARTKERKRREEWQQQHQTEDVKPEEVLELAEKAWQAVLARPKPFDRLSAFNSDFCDRWGKGKFLSLLVHRGASMEQEIATHIIDPILEADLTGHGTKLLLQAVANVARVDPKEGHALLVRCLGNENIFNLVRTALTSTNYQEVGHDSDIVKKIAMILYAKPLYPTVEPEELNHEWEYYNARLHSPMRRTKKEWIVPIDTDQIDGKVRDAIENVQIVLAEVLPKEASQRPRSDGELRDAAFHLRMTIKANTMILSSTSSTAAGRSIVENAATGLEEILDWVYEQQKLPESKRSSGEELVPRLLELGVRYTNASDPATAEEERSAAHLTTLLLDQEAEAGYALSARRIPILDAEQWQERWMNLAMEGKYNLGGEQSCRGTPDESGDQQSEQSENNETDETMEKLREDLLNQLDNPEENENDYGDSLPELPFAGELSENPKVVAELSEALEGDAQYIVRKICTRFDNRYCAHMPANETESVALRSLLQSALENTDSKTVTLRMQATNETVVPHISGGAIQDVAIDNEGAQAGWAGHWSQRIRTNRPAEITVTYDVPRVDRKPGQQTASEVLAALPAELQTLQQPISQEDELPVPVVRELESVRNTLDTQPLTAVVQQVQSIIYRYYEYHFIVNNPVYKEKYRDLLTRMPFTNSDRNEYLAFIHSLRQEHEEVQGRGVCGQLATVILALRHLGIPAAFATGWRPESTTITSNEGHAFALVPMLDANGQWIAKPVEAAAPVAAEEPELSDDATEIAEKKEPQDQEKEAEADDDQQVTEVVTEQPVELPTELHEWRQQFSAALGQEVSLEDINTVGLLVKAASTAHSDRQQAQDVQANLASQIESGHVVERDLADVYSNVSFLFTPAIQQQAEQLADAVDISATQRQLLDHMMQQNSVSYDKWSQERGDAPLTWAMRWRRIKDGAARWFGRSKKQS